MGPDCQLLWAASLRGHRSLGIWVMRVKPSGVSRVLLEGLGRGSKVVNMVGKDSDAGRDSGQEEKGMTEDEMAGWHH